ncbi:MAG: hypothetical protein CSA81_12840 [Acidobacteria bacterium]|nr:MAG: hypothetical protein CSA81_12840 [Acidobacteriota bacterium]
MIKAFLQIFAIRQGRIREMQLYAKVVIIILSCLGLYFAFCLLFPELTLGRKVYSPIVIQRLVAFLNPPEDYFSILGKSKMCNIGENTVLEVDCRFNYLGIGWVIMVLEDPLAIKNIEKNKLSFVISFLNLEGDQIFRRSVEGYSTHNYYSLPTPVKTQFGFKYHDLSKTDMLFLFKFEIPKDLPMNENLKGVVEFLKLPDALNNKAISIYLQMANA